MLRPNFTPNFFILTGAAFRLLITVGKDVGLARGEKPEEVETQGLVERQVIGISRRASSD